MIRFSYAAAFSLTLGGIIWLGLTWHDYTDIVSCLLITSGVLVAGLASLAKEAAEAAQCLEELHVQTAQLDRDNFAER